MAVPLHEIPDRLALSLASPEAWPSALPHVVMGGFASRASLRTLLRSHHSFPAFDFHRHELLPPPSPRLQPPRCGQTFRKSKSSLGVAPPRSGCVQPGNVKNTGAIPRSSFVHPVTGSQSVPAPSFSTFLYCCSASHNGAKSDAHSVRNATSSHANASTRSLSTSIVPMTLPSLEKTGKIASALVSPNVVK